MLKQVIFIWMCFFQLLLFSQNSKKFIIGKVLDDNQNPISNVHITVKNKSFGTITNHKGLFFIDKINFNDTLILSHISYIKEYIYINQFTDNKDTICVFSILKESSEHLPSVDIFKKKKFIEVASQQILDYTFVNNKLLLLNTDVNGIFLTLEKVRNNLPRIKKKGKFIFDVLGNIHILTEDSVFQLIMNHGDINILESIDIESYNNKLRPLKVLNDKSLVFEDISIYENRTWHHQMRLFCFLNLKTKEKKELLRLFDNINYEYSKSYYFSILKIYYEETTEGKNIIEQGLWDGDVNSLNADDPKLIQEIEWYSKIASKPIYSPIITFSKSYSIFDFSNKEIYNFDENNKLISNPNLLIPNDLNVVNNILYDKVLEEIYIVSETSGFVTLILLNPKTGSCGKRILIPSRFSKNIKVNNGFVYYIVESNIYGEHDKLYRFPL